MRTAGASRLAAGIVSMLAGALLATGCVKGDKSPARDESAVAPVAAGSVPVAAGSVPVAAGSAPVAAGSGVTAVDSESAARAAVGKVVRISGTAEDAKLAGVVVSGDLTVYCLDRRFGWSDQAGTSITIEGTLEQSGALAATKQPDGTMAAGTGGAVFVIRVCTLR